MDPKEKLNKPGSSNDDLETQESTYTFYGPQNEPIDITKNTELFNNIPANFSQNQILGPEYQDMSNKFNKTNMLSNPKFPIEHGFQANKVLVGEYPGGSDISNDDNEEEEEDDDEEDEIGEDVDDEKEERHIIDDVDGKSEDEGIGDYKNGGYHPVYVGEILIDRYVIIQKLGWGHFSTVWLTKDFKYNTYVAIKVQKSASHYLEAAYDEVELLQKAAKHSMDKKWLRRQKTHWTKEGRKTFTREDCHVVQLLNAFIYKGPYGNHFCMVFEILGVNLLEIIKRYEYKGVPMNLCKKIAKQILIGLDYQHNICNIIHTDLKPENVLLCQSKKEIADIIENGQLSKIKKHEEKIKQYEHQYGFKNLRQIIAEFKEDFKEELAKTENESDNDHVGFEVEVSSENENNKENSKNINNKNNVATEVIKNYDVKPKPNTLKAPKQNVEFDSDKEENLRPNIADLTEEFDVDEEFQKCLKAKPNMNKNEKKNLKKKLKKKLKRIRHSDAVSKKPNASTVAGNEVETVLSDIPDKNPLVVIFIRINLNRYAQLNSLEIY